ncbi:MAG: pyridoxamine 5'-phosphate oxidase family protein, partial [Cyanobacteria bacterium J06648_11]
MSKLDFTAAAQALLRDANYAILSTLSVQLPGYPFGSVVPCALTRAYEPILCISDLAEHAQNIKQDPRVALTAIAPNSAPETQSGGRFTYVGDAQLVPADRLDDVRSQFLALVPSARVYAGFGDFHFYTLAMTRGRFIGGFGAIAWIEPEAFAMPDPIATRASLPDLNAQLSDQLDLLDAEVVSVDRYGCNTLATGETPHRWSFAEPLAISGDRFDAAILREAVSAALAGQ